MKLFSVNEVEDLEHDEGVKDEGEVSRDDHSLFVDVLVVPAAIDVFHSTASDCATNNAIVPLVAGVVCENCCIQSIKCFWNVSFGSEHQCDHNDELEDSLTDDVLEHCL